MPEEKKLPFEIRLVIAIEDYTKKFGEHPPTFGYEDEELYQLLLISLKSGIEMTPMDERIQDALGLSDDKLVDT